MKPTLNTVHNDRALTNLVINYGPQRFPISENVFPWHKVPDETGLIWSINRLRMSGASGASPLGNKSLRSEDGTAKTLGGFAVSTQSYRCEEYAYNDILFDRIRDKADSALKLRSNMAEMIQESLLRDREFRALALAGTAGNWGATAAAAAAWDVVGTDTRVDMELGKTSIRSKTLGMVQNKDMTLMIGRAIFEELKLNTDILNRVKYVQRSTSEDMTPGLLASYWDIGNVVIPETWYNVAAEGQTESLTTMWDNDQCLLYANMPASDMYVGAGLTFSTLPGGSRVRTWRDQPRKGEIIENEMMADEVIVNSNAGYMITGLNT